MEARPHPVVEALVGRLLPPACREHVLGDLHERYTSPRQYVRDAALTIPLVIWGQVRRTSTVTLAAAELGVVYLVFLSAAGMLDRSVLSDESAPLRPAIPALAALVAMVLRDAWAGPAPRVNVHVALDALLAAALTVVPQTVLVAIQSPLALRADVFLAGCAISLVMLSGTRVALSPTLHRGAAAVKAGENPMNPKQSAQTRVGMQQDLRIWWWTILILGLAAAAALFAFPLTRPFRPVVVAWLIAFLLIGTYQRRKTLWPSPPSERDSTVSAQSAYRAALARRRDAQSRWPARRGPIAGGLIALAFLTVAVRLILLRPHGSPTLLFGPFEWLVVAFASCVMGLYVFTRMLTNRAARAFQREIDALDSAGGNSSP